MLQGLRYAFEHGVALFDVADVYGHGRAERKLGQFVIGIPRDGVVLSSKVGYFPSTAAHGYHSQHMRYRRLSRRAVRGSAAEGAAVVAHETSAANSCAIR